MKIKNLLMIGLVAVGSCYAEGEVPELKGKRTPPKAAVSSPVDQRMAMMREVVDGLRAEDVDVVTEFIGKVYDLKAKYVEVLEKERELRQTTASDDAQKELMKQYVALLNEEKNQAKELIETVIRDLEAHESRLLQVMAKVFRIGDREMKTTIMNIRGELKKFVRYQLHNGTEGRQFFMNTMRFLDQYFRM